jgi:hypothetical protein
MPNVVRKCQHENITVFENKIPTGKFTVKFCKDCNNVLVSTTTEQWMTIETFETEWAKILKARK